MTIQRLSRIAVVTVMCLGVAACGSKKNTGTSAFTSGDAPPGGKEFGAASAPTRYEKSSFWSAFGPNTADQTVNVNRFIWNASLDVLSFLPVESVDPFTGIIVTGYGVPPGGGRSYRATVYITDPALDARSLKVAMQTKGGPVSSATARAVEDSILSRARQMRIADNKL